ncbi:phosphonate ABC transporter, permease protein PhnE [Tumebacillus lacus]
MSQTQQAAAPKKMGRMIKTALWLIFFAALYIWSFTGLEVEWKKIMESLKIVNKMLAGIFTPEWGFIWEDEGVLDNMLVTLEIALLGTTIAAILAVPFGFLAANNMSKRYPILPFVEARFPVISWIGKRILNVIRTMPELIVAIIFIVGVGPTAFAGVLAIGLHSIGLIGKLYSEAIENMDEGPMEAITACGGSRLQVLWFAVVPQVLPEFFSFALYKFEINVRAASILGMVGAGGIGTPLLFALKGHDWHRVGAILLVVIIVVFLIDMLSGAIRKRLV